MPATIKIANHDANLISDPQGVDSRESLLDTLHGANTHGDILQSSLDRGNIPPVLLAHKNGFVEAVTAAYSRHHHLTLRPESAKKLYGKFVAHEGQKKLEIVYEDTTRYDVDFADFAQKIRCLISKNVVDDETCRWITPDFSTTTKDDAVVANIMMMGTLQAYFRYSCRMTCGIPSVTLLGIKQDYEEILRRLDKLTIYGKESGAFAEMLRPILRGFIRSFDEPEHPDVRDFWEKICDERRGSGFHYCSGWITAFCFWDGEGERQVFPRNNSRGCTLEGVGYGHVELNKVPRGFTKVPVHLIDNGIELEAEMIAGSVGVNCTGSGKRSFGRRDRGTGHDAEPPWLVHI
ncbi:hypothetical protein PG996_007652 [Apiospora saccharicola]|uniref:Uncharacterized protein n=1 Tax=Apiospora saccharicola TaxID=335842 RepID=A0ABR1VE77_9PEZI